MVRSICGIDIDVEKKNVKRLTLRVDMHDGSVRLTAPKRVTNAEIESFAASKREWILEKQRLALQRSENGSIAYREGDTIFVWGRPYTLHLECGGKNALIIEEDGTAVLTLRADTSDAGRERFIKEWYRRELTDAATPLIKKWAGITGLYPDSLMTKDMRTRWGTCNTKDKRIWLNLRLAQHPPECLEYVVLHELAHLRIPNHGSEFKALLDCYMPDWKRRKELLNRG